MKSRHIPTFPGLCKQDGNVYRTVPPLSPSKHAPESASVRAHTFFSSVMTKKMEDLTETGVLFIFAFIVNSDR